MFKKTNNCMPLVEFNDWLNQIRHDTTAIQNKLDKISSYIDPIINSDSKVTPTLKEYHDKINDAISVLDKLAE